MQSSRTRRAQCWVTWVMTESVVLVNREGLRVPSESSSQQVAELLTVLLVISAVGGYDRWALGCFTPFALIGKLPHAPYL